MQAICRVNLVISPTLKCLCLHFVKNTVCARFVWQGSQTETRRFGSCDVEFSLSKNTSMGKIDFDSVQLDTSFSMIFVSDVCCMAGRFLNNDVYVSLYSKADLCSMAGWSGQLQIHRQGESIRLWIVLLGKKCGFYAQIDLLYTFPLAKWKRFLQRLLLCVHSDLCLFVRDGCYDCQTMTLHSIIVWKWNLLKSWWNLNRIQDLAAEKHKARRTKRSQCQRSACKEGKAMRSSNQSALDTRLSCVEEKFWADWICHHNDYAAYAGNKSLD